MQWGRLEWEGWKVELTDADDEALEGAAEGVEERDGITVWELSTQVGVWVVQVDGDTAVVTGDGGSIELLDAVIRGL